MEEMLHKTEKIISFESLKCTSKAKKEIISSSSEEFFNGNLKWTIIQIFLVQAI